MRRSVLTFGRRRGIVIFFRRREDCFWTILQRHALVAVLGIGKKRSMRSKSIAAIWERRWKNTHFSFEIPA